MIQGNLGKWKNISKLEPLLYFGEISYELLSTKSYEKYMLSTLNVRLLIEEIRDVIVGVEEGTITYGSLPPLIDELKFMLREDAIVPKIIGHIGVEYYLQLRFDHLQLIELKSTIEKLHIDLNKNLKYFETVKSLLSAAVTQNTNKKDIEKLAKAFYIELINYGYHKRYIYFVIKNFFFSGNWPKEINDISQINQFVNIFKLEKKSYEVIFRGERSSFLKLKGSVENLGLKIIDNFESCKGKYFQLDKFIENSTQKDVLIQVELEAYDETSAKEIAEESIEYITDVYAYFQHKKRPAWNDEVIVINKHEERAIHLFVKDEINEGHENKIIFNEKSQQLLHKIMTSYKSTKDYKFKRGLELHGMAMNTRYIENQFLNLWSIFETMFLNNEKDKILKLCNVLIPFICKEYISKILFDLYSNLVDYNPDIKVIVENCKLGSSVEEKLAAIIIQENSSAYRRIEEEIIHYPLLQNRLKWIKSNITSSEKLYELVERYRQKIEWHIKRMYRARNFMLHEGKVFSNIHLLVDNLHSYIDSVINQLWSFMIKNDTTAIDHISIEVDMRYSYHIRRLKEAMAQKKEITLDNFKDLLFSDQFEK
ncbi:MAG: hypothetical protein NTX05_07630 [Fusobacteria bacterium]|nr:hypothetical protein [Fusobacteriota bacterium]